MVVIARVYRDQRVSGFEETPGHEARMEADYLSCYFRYEVDLSTRDDDPLRANAQLKRLWFNLDHLHMRDIAGLEVGLQLRRVNGNCPGDTDPGQHCDD